MFDFEKENYDNSGYFSLSCLGLGKSSNITHLQFQHDLNKFDNLHKFDDLWWMYKVISDRT